MSSVKVKARNSSAKTSRSKNPKEVPDTIEKKYPFARIFGVGSKVSECMLLYGIENIDRLRNFSAEDAFPIEKYYTLNEKIEHTRGDGEKKKTPFNISRSSKIIIQWLCGRFVWEVTNIDTRSYHSNKNSEFILNGVQELENNISEIIVHTTEKIQISNLIKNSHGLVQEFMIKIGPYIDNIDLNFYVSKTLVQFIKIIAYILSNSFWFNNTRTIGERNFKAALACCDIYHSDNAKSFNDGLINELNDFIKYAMERAPRKQKDESKEDEIDDDDEASNSSKSSRKKKKKNKKKDDSDHEEEDEGDNPEDFDYESDDE